MMKVIASFSVLAALASPVLAEGMAGDMACSAFNMLDHDGMAAAMKTAQMPGDASTSDGGMMASDGMMAADEGMMAADDALNALIKTCTEHPDMMVKDALMPMK